MCRFCNTVESIIFHETHPSNTRLNLLVDVEIRLKVFPACFEMEILITFEKYFMAPQKECRCLCSVSDVYALPVQPPLSEKFHMHTQRLQLKVGLYEEKDFEIHYQP